MAPDCVMTTLGFVLRRTLAQRLLGLAVVVALAFTVGVLVAGPVYATAAREAVLSSLFSTSGVTLHNVRFQAFGERGFGWQQADAAVRDVPRCGGTGRTFVAPSESQMPVPARATCMTWRAKSQAGCSMCWCAAVMVQDAV